MKALALLGFLALGGCTATAGLSSVEPIIQGVAGSPSMICSTLIQQEAQSLSTLRAQLNGTPAVMTPTPVAP